MAKFETVNFEDIKTPTVPKTENEKRFGAIADSLKEYFAEAADSVAKVYNLIDAQNDRMESFSSGLTSLFEDMRGYMKDIAMKEYPTFPSIDIPKTEFPKVQKVEVTNQAGSEDVKNLLSKIVVLLSEKQPIMQPIIMQAPMTDSSSKDTIGDTAHAAQVNVRTRSKSRLVTEVPTGTINGTNKTFFLSRAPRYNTQIFLFLDGSYQQIGAKADYVITGNQIVYTLAPPTSATHYALIFSS